MKKSINIFLAVVFMVISAFSFVVSANEKNVLKLGDINNNGKIDMTDYILLKRAYFNTYNLSDIQKMCGDCNQNEKIDMTDYILLKRVYFGTFTFQNPDIIISDTSSDSDSADTSSDVDASDTSSDVDVSDTSSDLDMPDTSSDSSESSGPVYEEDGYYNEVIKP